MSSFSINLDLARMGAVVDALEADVNAAMRPAAQAGAQVLYEAVKANADRIRKRGVLSHAVYQVFSEDNSNPALSTYHIGVNQKRAGWAHNVEYGHVERFAHYRDEQGRIRLKVRPEMAGKPRPMRGGRGRNRAQLDAYYVLLPVPVHVPAQPFMRSAFDASSGRAYQAMLDEIERRLKEKGR